MLTTSLEAVIGTGRDVDWGNGTSRRLLVRSDGRGYTITDTLVRPNTETLLRYDHHLESCYCVEGEGFVEVADVRIHIVPGLLYAPDRGEEHKLSATDAGLRLICVFNPALTGLETHSHSPETASGYSL